MLEKKRNSFRRTFEAVGRNVGDEDLAGAHGFGREEADQADGTGAADQHLAADRHAGSAARVHAHRERLQQGALLHRPARARSPFKRAGLAFSRATCLRTRSTTTHTNLQPSHIWLGFFSCLMSDDV